MAWDLDTVVGPGGWATTAELTSQVSRGTVQTWVAAGRLVRLRPGVYATPQAAGQWLTRVAAAVSGRGALASHGTALALWELAPSTDGPVHVSVEAWRSGRGSAGVVLHRQADLLDARRRVHGLPVTSVERSVVDTWGSPDRLARSAVRAAAITAVRGRRCRPADLAYELSRRPRLRGRAELVELVQLLDRGCESELEIWGCRHVLQGPGMPQFTHQYGSPSRAAASCSMRRVTRYGWLWRWTARLTTARLGNGRPTSGGTRCWRPSAGRPSGSVTRG
jgi:hypothetical protein